MEFITLETVNCIVTGKPAVMHSGHVVAEGLCQSETRTCNYSILAGFADDEAYKSVKSDKRGCFGEWKPEFGVQVKTED